MIYLLDLNYTLVANSAPRGTTPQPMHKRLETETYRQWLVEMLRPHRVILITARPERWKKPTLERIQTLTGWKPMDSFFAEGGAYSPPAVKRQLLIERILPKYGEVEYCAIESNPKTRSMYESFRIPSMWVNSAGDHLQNAEGLISAY